MGRRRKKGSDWPSGLLVLDKPKGITSFAVVKRVREVMGVRKAGHTGTLDPLATGVLPICLNEATKVAGLLLSEKKSYLAEAQLGVCTDSYDITGQETKRCEVVDIDERTIEQALGAFRGTIEQRPPAFSALHKDGKRAHELAREGKNVELESREVTIKRLDLLGYDAETSIAKLSVQCSKGTYIRSLVADLGEALGCGATVFSLRRIQSGQFSIEQARALESLSPECPLLSLDQILTAYVGCDLDKEAVSKLAQGQPVDAEPYLLEDEAVTAEATIRVRYQGQVVALGNVREGRLWPYRVFGSVVEAVLGD
jgi:tRNA pseudouridine55 synthase